jgi:predicted unusual protein kinase regulating ubiquinone biosynthesis (AarF/ABC1/UbiB family)
METIEKSKIYLKLSKYLLKYSDFTSGTKSDEISALGKSSSRTEDAKNFVKDIESLGPTFIKLGQVLSTRKELLPTEFTDELCKLHSDVDPVEYSIIEKIVEDELGVKIKSVFESFDKEPLAAASLGQVHRAVLKSGQIVVVKIQRPNILQTITDDIKLIYSLVGYLEKFSETVRRFNPNSMIAEFERTLLQELDYNEEAHNIEVISKNLQNFEKINFPKVYKSYTTSKILTMDFIDGKKFSDISNIKMTEVDGEKIALEVFKAYLQQIFVDGFFHSDPHLGNLLFIEPDRIGILDLGMVTKLGPDLRSELLSLVVAISDGRGYEASEIAYRLVYPIESVTEDMASFKQSLARMVKDEHGKSVAHVKAGTVLFEVCKIASSAGLYFPPELSSIARTLMYLEELGNILDPNFNPNEAVKNQAVKLLKDNFKEDMSLSDVFLSTIEAKRVIEKIPSNFNKVLDDLANKKLSIKVDAIDEDKIMVGIQKIANRITSGLILAALIIGAAMLMNIKSSFILLGYPGFAIILFLIATIGSLFLLINIFFRDE